LARYGTYAASMVALTVVCSSIEGRPGQTALLSE